MDCFDEKNGEFDDEKIQEWINNYKKKHYNEDLYNWFRHEYEEFRKKTLENRTFGIFFQIPSDMEGFKQKYDEGVKMVYSLALHRSSQSEPVADY